MLCINKVKITQNHGVIQHFPVVHFVFALRAGKIKTWSNLCYTKIHTSKASACSEWYAPYERSRNLMGLWAANQKKNHKTKLYKYFFLFFLGSREGRLGRGCSSVSECNLWYLEKIKRSLTLEVKRVQRVRAQGSDFSVTGMHKRFDVEVSINALQTKRKEETMFMPTF